MGERTWCDGCGPLRRDREDDVLCESCWGDVAAEATGRERARIVAAVEERIGDCEAALARAKARDDEWLIASFAVRLEELRAVLEDVYKGGDDG